MCTLGQRDESIYIVEHNYWKVVENGHHIHKKLSYDLTNLLVTYQLRKSTHAYFC